MFQNFMSTASHEGVEAVTDPQPFTGWSPEMKHRIAAAAARSTGRSLHCALQRRQLPTIEAQNRGGGGSRRISDGRPGPLERGVLDGAPPDPMNTSGRDRTVAVASLATALAAAVLEGDIEHAATIARTILARGLT
jgi:hypothetical protein